MKSDDLTKYLRTTLNLLLLKYPVRTSMGFLLGFSTSFFAELFRPILSTLSWINLNAITYWQTCLVGAFVFNLPSLTKKSHLSEDIEDKLKVVRISKQEGGLSDAHVRMLYQAVAMDVIQSTRFTSEIEKEIESRE